MAEETIQGGTADQWAEYGKSLSVDIPEINWKDVGNVALDFTPIIGDIKGGYETVQMIGDELAKDNPNYKLVGILGGMGAAATIIGLVPGVGDIAKKAIMSGAKSVAKSANNLVDAMPTYDPNTMGSLGGNIFAGQTSGAAKAKVLSELGDESRRWLSSLAKDLGVTAEDLFEEIGPKLKNLEVEMPEAFTIFDKRELFSALQEASEGASDLAVIDPRDFKKIAAQINTEVPSINQQMIDKVSEYSGDIETGTALGKVPYLSYDTPTPNTAQFVMHDGRHRNRAMEALGYFKNLVRVVPSGNQKLASKLPEETDAYTEISNIQLEGQGGKKVAPMQDIFKYLSIAGAPVGALGALQNDEQNGI